jgi:hypothetical protein
METIARELAPTTAPRHAPITFSDNGRLRLTHPTRGYAVTRNPFAIPAILPLVTLAFAALAIAEHFGDYQVTLSAFGNVSATSITVAAFLIISCGILLIPAVALKGSLNLTHDGVTFERGSEHLTASWKEVTGLVHRFDSGLCLTFEGAQQTRPTMRLPGGFSAVNGSVRIPLRMFGDRQFSIIYDLRDRLPEASWLPALHSVEQRSVMRNLAVYSAAVLIGVGAMAAVAYSILH